jgi:hypothetical protein
MRSAPAHAADPHRPAIPPAPPPKQKVYLRKLGGATVKVKDLGPVTKVGSARRLGPAASDDALWEYEAPAAPALAAAGAGAGGGDAEGGSLEGRVFYARRPKPPGAPRGSGGAGAAKDTEGSGGDSSSSGGSGDAKAA